MCVGKCICVCARRMRWSKMYVRELSVRVRKTYVCELAHVCRTDQIATHNGSPLVTPEYLFVAPTSCGCQPQLKLQISLHLSYFFRPLPPNTKESGAQRKFITTSLTLKKCSGWWRNFACILLLKTHIMTALFISEERKQDERNTHKAHAHQVKKLDFLWSQLRLKYVCVFVSVRVCSVLSAARLFLSDQCWRACIYMCVYTYVCAGMYIFFFFFFFFF